MFTGIVQEIGRVVSAQTENFLITAGDVLTGLRLGASVAVNGACLTITGFESSSFSVDIMPETGKRTNLGLLRPGDKVNLERPMTLRGELGGHLVQGHIDDTGKIVSINREGEATLIKVEASSEIMRYIVTKGFITVDGVSLTIVSKDISSFRVSVVDFTFKHTTLGSMSAGSLVNLEIDIIAKYVEQFSQAQKPGVTADFLQEHGFLVS